jgi:hypothetical protein
MHIVIRKCAAVTLYSNRKFFRVFPFEHQVNEPTSNGKKVTGRVIRRARQTWGLMLFACFQLQQK